MDVHKVTTTFLDKLEVIWTTESTVMPGYLPGNRMKIDRLKLSPSLAYLSRTLSSTRLPVRIPNVRVTSI